MIKKIKEYDVSKYIKRGDVLSVYRGAYSHFGIYAGSQRVIHYTSDNEIDSDAYIQETSLNKFLKGDVLLPLTDKRIREMYDIKCEMYNGEETLLRAISKLGTGRGKYHLVTNNCEHFAIWCKTGAKHSAQVRSAVDKVLDLIAGSETDSVSITQKSEEIFISIEDNPQKDDISDDDIGRYGNHPVTEQGIMDVAKRYVKSVGANVLYNIYQLYYLSQTDDCPTNLKYKILLCLGYFIAPLDLIPDFIPVVGLSDDIAVILKMYLEAQKYISPEIKKKAKQRVIGLLGKNIEVDWD